MSGYHGGHILRIKVINFMTYDELEIFPKSGLNLIIGLNGSGKSSIMCAICLGLAGKPQFTGRSSKLSDFIKFGCEEARIEIELEAASMKNVVISRTIQGDKSTWLLNNNVVTLSEIENIVRTFNIDISNLCQFLPQEKVMEFSKMDKKQRLENMLKTVGDQELFNTFKELKQIREKSMKLEEEIKKLQILKDSDEQEIQRLKVEVDKQEEKLRMKEHLKSLQQHKMFLEYNEIHRKVTAVKSEKTALIERRKILSDTLEIINEKYNTKSKVFNEAVEQMKILDENIDPLRELMTRKKTEMLELREKVDNAKIHYQNKIQEKRLQILKLTEIDNQIQALQELYNESESVCPVLKKKNEEISQNLVSVKKQLPSLASIKILKITEKNKLEQSIKENMEEIKKLESEEDKKMQLLKQRFKDVYDAVIWLEKNKNIFRAPVHKPMFLTMKVNQEDSSKYIENLVRMRDLLAFICEDKEDSKLLTNIFRKEMNLNVNIVMVSDDPVEYYQSPNLTPELKQLGVICFLKDIIEAPDAIKRFLCHCYNLHSVPICSSSAEENMNKLLLHESKISLFFTPDAKIQGKRSKYGDNNFCIGRYQLKLDNFLPCSKDCSEKSHLLKTQLQLEKDKLDEVNEKLKNIGIETKELEQKENSLREEKRGLLSKLQTYSTAEIQLNQKINLRDRKKTELVNEYEEKSKLTDLIRKANIERKTIYLEMLNIFQNFLKWKKDKLCCNLKARLVQKVLTNIHKSGSELERESEEAKKKCQDLSSKSKEFKEEGFALRDNILEWISSYEEAKKKGLFSFFSVENKAEIEQEIRRAQAYIDLACDENEMITTDYYEERKEKIVETEKLIKNYELNLLEFQAETIKKRSLWLPQLQNHIQKINAKFSEYYKQLNYSGEIILDTCNDTDDFVNYGLQITLKYRDSEPLLELSNTHHSGGECSVAAIIFILSLQGFTDIPFRCIDEINQGMDSLNERNMYDLIAQSAKNESCLQYFLLTPKLLMNLEMIEQMDIAVHVIYNSCFLGMKINVAEDSKFVKKRKKVPS